MPPGEHSFRFGNRRPASPINQLRQVAHQPRTLVAGKRPVRWSPRKRLPMRPSLAAMRGRDLRWNTPSYVFGWVVTCSGTRNQRPTSGVVATGPEALMASTRTGRTRRCPMLIYWHSATADRVLVIIAARYLDGDLHGIKAWPATGNVMQLSRFSNALTLSGLHDE